MDGKSLEQTAYPAVVHSAALRRGVGDCFAATVLGNVQPRRAELVFLGAKALRLRIQSGRGMRARPKRLDLLGLLLDIHFHHECDYYRVCGYAGLRGVQARTEGEYAPATRPFHIFR